MRKYLFLYLALACFLGLLVVFVVDGYLGIYDTLRVTSGEQSFVIEPDYWLGMGRPFGVGEEAYYLSPTREDRMTFRYEIDNRSFSSYQAEVEVSVWRSQEKIADVFSQALSVAAFDKGEWQWVVDNADFVPADIPPEQYYQYTLSIRRGEIERKIIINANPQAYPAKPGIIVPVPPVPAR
ncbi:MAG: hypothetical protein Q8O55_01065 [Dehalococcoidales bacterium]|nr:hypothetical protein [Dehalococcoidales bacterium]